MIVHYGHKNKRRFAVYTCVSLVIGAMVVQIGAMCSPCVVVYERAPGALFAGLTRQGLYIGHASHFYELRNPRGWLLRRLHEDCGMRPHVAPGRSSVLGFEWGRFATGFGYRLAQNPLVLEPLSTVSYLVVPYWAIAVGMLACALAIRGMTRGRSSAF